jgi:hypothetical protein
MYLLQQFSEAGIKMYPVLQMRETEAPGISERTEGPSLMMFRIHSVANLKKLMRFKKLEM